MAVELEAARLPAYSDMLGMYLGDGHLVLIRKTYRLEISLHERRRR